MDLRVLKSFMTICKVGNITRAAEELHISQPALTRQLQDLEDELGCRLLERSTRSLKLTEAGFLFQRRADEILSLATQAKQELSRKGNFLRGIIRVGIVETSAMELLTQEIKAFSEAHPHVLFEIYSADSDDLKRSLDENKLDAAILLEPVESAKYDKTVFPVSERWGVAVKEDTFPKDKEYITHQELTKMPLILPRRYIVLDEIASWLKVPEKSLKIAAYHNIPSNALSLVAGGFGELLCVEGSFINRGKFGIRFVPIKPERISGHVAVRKKNRALVKAAELFWDRLTRFSDVEFSEPKAKTDADLPQVKQPE